MNPISAPAVKLAISMPGGSELLLILLIVIVVFGHSRIPALGEALGKGIRNFKKSMSKEEEAQKIASEASQHEEAKVEPQKTQDANKVL